MKIALDATYSLGSHLSGVGVYSLELMRQMAEISPDTDFAWCYRPHRFRLAFQHPVPANVRRQVLLDRALWRNTKLFHGLNQRLPLSRFPLQIVTFHDLFVMTAEYSTREFRARFTAQARHAAREADCIIAVSQFTADQVVNLLGANRSRVEVIPHGVRALPLTSVPREKIILHVGAIQTRKNLVRLVRAFAAVPEDWRLVLAGSAGYGATEIYDEITRSRASQRILVTGYLPVQELALWYSKASVFAFPSLDEGFGMPVIEAMAAGVPVLGSKTSAVGEVCANAAWLVDPLSEFEIAEGLRILTRQEDVREQFKNAGSVRAARFTWPDAAARTLNIYRRLLGK